MKLDAGKKTFLIFALIYIGCILLLPAINYLRFITGDGNYPPLTRLVRYPLLLYFVVFFTVYALFVHFIRRIETGVNLRMFLIITIALGFYLCAMKPVFSIDLFEYISRGRIMSVYGSNPYLVPPSNYPNDLFYPIIFWKFQPTIYGPLWSWLAYLPTKLAGNNVFMNVFLMKTEFLAFFLLAGFQVFRLSQALGLKRPWLYAELFLFNPYLIIMSLVDGHNDIVMMFFCCGL